MSEGIENRPSVCPKTMTSNVVEEYCASPKPLKPRYGDRFIPSRVGNTWDLTFEVISYLLLILQYCLTLIKSFLLPFECVYLF